MKNFKGVQNHITLGLNLAVGIGGCVFIGYWIDQKVGQGQTWTMVGIFTGMLYLSYEIWKLLRESDELDD